MTKRMIEEWLPIAEISEESKRKGHQRLRFHLSTTCMSGGQAAHLGKLPAVVGDQRGL